MHIPRMKNLYLDRDGWGLETDEKTGLLYVSIPVRNKRADYEEWYEIDQETFDKFKADPSSATEFVAKARRRELDDLLLLKPGTDRGHPV